VSSADSALILAWVAIILLGLGLAGLQQQLRALAVGSRRSVRLGPTLGMPAPGLGVLGLPADASTLLIFASSSCTVCHEAVEQAGQLQQLAGETGVVFVFRDTVPAEASTRASTRVVDAGFFDTYGIQSTPFVVRVVDGVVESASHAGSVPILREMVARAAIRQGGDVSGNTAESSRRSTASFF
jgi:hypothetical protein